MLIHFLACGGVSDMIHHKLRCLNIWSQWWHDLGRFRMCGFAKESMSLEMGFEASKPHAFPSSLPLCFLLAVQDVSTSHPDPACRLPPLFLARMDAYSCRTISPNKPFLLIVALIMVFYHGSRKVTKAESIFTF